MKRYYRGIVYCIGLIVLALGIILNTKTGLGVSPIISIPYSISNIWKVNLGNATLCIYILCVFAQFLLRGKKFRSFDLLQIPMSFVFSKVINLFNDIIVINFSSLYLNVLLLIVAIMLTGIGVVMTVEMNFIPNAADGLTQALAYRLDIKLGLSKNIIDMSSVLITIVIGLLSVGQVVGIGFGTLIAVIGVGRAIALVKSLFRNNILAFAD
ncbi:YczE/YyaS/YitT family protein [Clostridium saccharoperbutylacetonicum]|uniref:YczE/YyaS/YitT family protein n=1 Tax=Clostridium saccharoperbutylacetonicum TaxID=36745 RepID=UPI0039EB8CF6